MTVTSTESSITYTGNGSATEFNFFFQVLGRGADADIRVSILDIATLENTIISPSEYELFVLPSLISGRVRYPLSGPPLGSDKKITIYRELSLTQPINLENQTKYFATVAMEGYDRATLQIQQLKEEIDRKIGVPIGLETEVTYADFLQWKNEAQAAATQSGAEADRAGNEADRAEAEADRAVLAADRSETAANAAGIGQFQNGTAAAPAVTFTSDLNTGMYRVSEDVLGFSTNGVERVRVTNTGNVGVGVNNPSQKLEVSETFRVTGTGPKLSVLDTNAPTNEREWAILGADGPLRLLPFTDEGVSGSDYVEFTRVGNSGRTLRGLRSGATSYQLSNFDRSLMFSGGLGAVGTETVNDFAVRTNNTERMRVNSVGNVGIGTTAPTEKLHVEGNTLINGALSGTAVTQSQTDTTTGRLLKVGDFGLGAGTAPLIADLDSGTIRPGFYRTDSATLGVFPPSVNVFGHCLVEDYGGGNSKQTFQTIGSIATAQALMPWVRRRNATTGVWGEWSQHYGQNNIVRAVSQTGGVPTGGVIERGSNANGEFVRFADGTQICTAGITTSASADSTWTFPAAFSTITNLTPMGMAYTASTLVGVMGTGAAISTTAWTFVARDASNARISVFARLIAIGRWF